MAVKQTRLSNPDGATTAAVLSDGLAVPYRGPPKPTRALAWFWV